MLVFAVCVPACGSYEGRQPSNTGSLEVGYNFCPVFDIYTVAPSRVFVGGIASISVNVTDPEGDPMTFVWRAEHGSFERRYTPQTRYRCDTPGVQTLTLTVGDGGDCQSTFQVRVECRR